MEFQQELYENMEKSQLIEIIKQYHEKKKIQNERCKKYLKSEKGKLAMKRANSKRVYKPTGRRRGRPKKVIAPSENK
tara:strand:- start:612 stop:842 length:231 start_codon:yes stop_codon:yes gene_type:complete